MSIYYGNKNIADIYYGSKKIKEVYYGSEKVWGIQSAVQEGYWVHKDTGVKTYFDLTDPSITDGMMSAPSWAYDCSEVQIPSGVIGFWDWCFAGSSLSSINIPKGVTWIWDGCFNGCESLTSITIPEGVTRLEAYCFQGCSNIASITLPESITSLGSDCFNNCTALTSITIPEGVTNIREGCFNGCTTLTSIDIPEGVTRIEAYCFEQCSSLTSVNIPESVTSLDYRCFGYCTSLTSITLPESITSLGDHCFDTCANLTSITLPGSVTSIGENCFKDCWNLTSITLPEGVTNIGENCFQGCFSITTAAILPAIPPTLGSGAFDSVNVIKVRLPYVDDYKTATNWSVYADKISAIPNSLFVLGRINGVLRDGVNYTDKLRYLDYFTENIDEITYGWSSYAVISNGKLYTWGNNIWGQLGQGDNINRVTPKQVGVDVNWTKVSMGEFHTLAIKNGELYGWGNNDYRQLTPSILQYEYKYPTKLDSNNDWVEVYAFKNTSLGKRSNGLWYGWGNSNNGEIGYPNPPNDTNTFPPITQLPHSTILSGASKITFGKQHGLVINSGSLYGFGNGANYVFGNGDTRQYSSPVKLNDLTWTDIACGYNFSFGISNGELYFWGNPSNSVSGYGATETVTSPQKVDNNSDWTNIYIMKGENSESTVIGIRNGDAYIWGRFYKYREDLSSWTNIEISTPELLETNTNIINVVGGQRVMLILKQS